ncbi:DNA-protecting protein DprA [Pseudomonas sp. PDM28]|uniref:DNA-processing protein DprA n=1 Tax=Pseudomonas sp. PDM28 TaxID=2854770 RepID=UPI001C4850C5|nr:DNA-processing protein DprA [Pseudomonas sp. PDM28]MBV7552007.1 DNA-protecting protein DprA [Pseudomonas sp. PDM28]
MRVDSDSAYQMTMNSFNLANLFESTPIVPQNEMSAYESLWMGDGAWFANLAELFRSNPGVVPSELVPEEVIHQTWDRLVDTVGAERLRSIGIRVNGAGEYPKKLRDADHPVEVLYYQGNWELVETPSVAIVGTREPTAEGALNAGRIAHSLSKAGYTIVSGLAKGIDTAAHTAAIAAGGKTIAVIGTPLLEYYPKENKELQEEIAQRFLVISQVPFLRYKNQNYRTNRLFFPARNVTMSALTKATIIVEAGNTSGTLVQARAALAQGRKLFILDSCFRNPELTWPARFEKLGAIRIKNVTHLMDELNADTSLRS